MKRFLAGLLALLLSNAALAQTLPNQNFNPTGETSLSVTTTSAAVALATNQASHPSATTVLISNTGGTDARVLLGGSSCTATTSSYLVRSNETRAWYIGAQTYLCAITASSSTTLDIATGTGFPAGWSAGSSGGGGGGSVTQGTVPWVVAGQGTAGTPTGGVVSVQGVASGTAVPVSASSLPLPTGAATATNQTNTQGTVAVGTAATNSNLGGCVYNSSSPLPSSGQGMAIQCDASGNQLVTINPNQTIAMSGSVVASGSVGLNAGSNIIGKAGIDQTTPGTTNGVSVVGVNAATALAGAGATGTGSLRTTVAQDTTTIAGAAPGTAGTPSANVVTVQGASSMTPVLVTPSAPADPCFASSKSYANFESTTSGGSIITAVSAKKAYICAVAIVTSVAANVSLIEGTGSSVCTGGTPAAVFLNTGTTAANGAAFAANAGIAFGTGGASIAANATANQNICVLFTTTGTPQVNVHVAYVQQ